MAFVRIKGLNKKTVTAADGTRVSYWYAWKGGPRLPGRPGDPEFIAAYLRAVQERKEASGAPRETLGGLVARYKASPEYKGLADATRKEWARWLDRIAEDRDPAVTPEAVSDIGGLPLTLLDDRKVRRDLLEWRDRWADRPRSADYAMQVLSRVLAWGLDRGELAINAAAGISQLYDPKGRGDLVWTDAEIARFTAAASSPEVGFIVRLACLTGFRRGDLCKLADAHVGEVAIVKPTGKSRGKRNQVVPILPETAALIAEIRAQREARYAELIAQAKRKKRPPPVRPTTLLSNTKGRPWTPDGLEAQVVDTKAVTRKNGKPGAGIDKHLHDARGTFVTRLRKAGLKASEIADVVGWTEDRVERLLKTYVDQDAIVMSIAARLQRGEPGS